MKRTLKERFEAKVSFPGDPDGCWVWIGAVTGRSPKYRHGSIMVVSWKTEKASRVAWQLYRGEIAADMQVLHRCDNPLCVNPDHLFLGTHADNMADMKGKGRSTSGEKSARAKLSDSDVKIIRECATSHTAMARRFGVARTTISNIRRGEGWAHIPIPKGMVYQRAPRPQTEATKEKLRAYWRNRARLANQDSPQ